MECDICRQSTLPATPPSDTPDQSAPRKVPQANSLPETLSPNHSAPDRCSTSQIRRAAPSCSIAPVHTQFPNAAQTRDGNRAALRSPAGCPELSASTRRAYPPGCVRTRGTLSGGPPRPGGVPKCFKHKKGGITGRPAPGGGKQPK